MTAAVVTEAGARVAAAREAAVRVEVVTVAGKVEVVMAGAARVVERVAAQAVVTGRVRMERGAAAAKGPGRVETVEVVKVVAMVEEREAVP